jgi:sugar phosphate isomerase/epimerase
MLDFCVQQGVSAVEIGTGNWSGAPHIDLEEVVASESARTRWYDEMHRRGITLCALNCSGNPLAYAKDMEVTEKTFRLAQQLRPGLPGGGKRMHQVCASPLCSLAPSM